MAEIDRRLLFKKSVRQIGSWQGITSSDPSMSLESLLGNDSARIDSARRSSSAPSLQTRRDTSQSLLRVISSSTGFDIFMEFLRTQHATENLEFWGEVEKLHECPSSQVHEKVQEIFSVFVESGSAKEVNLPSKVKKELMEEKSKVVFSNRFLFDNAQDSILDLLSNDLFARFSVSSEKFKLYQCHHEGKLDFWLEKIRTSEDFHFKEKKGKRKFSGAQLFSWFQEHLPCSPENSMEICELMCSSQYFRKAKDSDKSLKFQPKDDVYYTFYADDDPAVLNMRKKVEEFSSHDIATELIDSLMSLKNAWNSEKYENRKIVDSLMWKTFLNTVDKFPQMKLNELKTSSRKAFLLNCYNAMVIHQSLLPKKSRNNLERKYLLGSEKLSLLTLREKILNEDKAKLGEFDPRVFFVLLEEGTKTAPSIIVLEAEKLNQLLRESVTSYLRETIKIENNELILPKLFHTHRKYFPATSQEILQWTSGFVDPDIKTQMFSLQLRIEESG